MFIFQLSKNNNWHTLLDKPSLQHAKKTHKTTLGWREPSYVPSSTTLHEWVSFTIFPSFLFASLKIKLSVFLILVEVLQLRWKLLWKWTQSDGMGTCRELKMNSSTRPVQMPSRCLPDFCRLCPVALPSGWAHLPFPTPVFISFSTVKSTILTRAIH